MICSRGIVLSAIRHSDDKVIINVYTLEAGMVSFLVRRSGHRNNSSGHVQAVLWQPLTVVDLVWRERRRDGLSVAYDATIAHPWLDLPFNPHKATIAMFLGELLGHVLRHEQSNPVLLNFIERSLSWLDAAPSGFANFHIVFLLGLSRHLGFEPNVAGWREGSFFDLRAAEFVEQRPSHSDYLEGGEASLVPRLMHLGYGQMRRVALSGNARKRILEVIVTFYRLHIAEVPEIRSLSILHDVYRS